MPRSTVSDSTYPESTAGPASPIFGTASFSTFTATALTSLWPSSSSRRNTPSNSSCGGDDSRSEMLEYHAEESLVDDGEATTTLRDDQTSQLSSSSFTYGHTRSSDSGSITDRTTTLASSHARSSTDPYTSSSGLGTHSLSLSTLTPSRSTPSYSDHTMSRQPQSAHTRSQTQSGLTSGGAGPHRRTGELIAFFEDRARAPAHARTASVPNSYLNIPASLPGSRSPSPSKPPSTHSLPLGMPGALAMSRTDGASWTRSSRGGSRSNLSGWSSGSRSERSRSPARVSSPTRSSVYSRSQTGSTGSGGGFLGAVAGFVGLSGRSAYSSGSRSRISASSVRSNSRSQERRRHSRTPSGSRRREITASSPRSPFSRNRGRRSVSVSPTRSRVWSPAPETELEEDEEEEDDEALAPPLDLSEHAGEGELISSAPIWFYNVHRLPPYTWNYGEAYLYSNMLLLTWIEPTSGRIIVKLDLLSCVEIRTSRPLNDRDVRVERDGRSMRLITFELLYSDSLERLGAETRVEMMEWFTAIQTVFNGNISVSEDARPGDQASPEQSALSLESSDEAEVLSQLESEPVSGAGSRSTVYIAASPRRTRAPLRTVTPPFGASVNSWRQRARQSDSSETSSVVNDPTTASGSHASSHNPSLSQSSLTRTGTSSVTRPTTTTLTSGSLSYGARTLLEIGSSTGTDVIASTISYRNTASASLLGDSCHGTSSIDTGTDTDRGGAYTGTRALGQAVDVPSSASGYQAEVDEPHYGNSAGATGQTGQSYSYSGAPGGNTMMASPAVSQSDSEYVTASSPSASFVSMDAMDEFPEDEEEDQFQEFEFPGVESVIGESVLSDSVVDEPPFEDVPPTPTQEVPEPEPEPIVLHVEEDVKPEVEPIVPPPEPAPIEPEEFTPVSIDDSIQAEPEPEVSLPSEEMLEARPEPPAAETTPAVHEVSVQASPQPEFIPLPPSEYTPSVISEVLPDQPSEVLEEAGEAVPDTPKSDVLSNLSLHGAPLSQLPVADDMSEVSVALPGTPQVLDAVTTQLLNAAEPEVEVEVESTPRSPSVAASWGAETDGTYDSSVLHASPSLRSEKQLQLRTQGLTEPALTEAAPKEAEESLVDPIEDGSPVDEGEDAGRTPTASVKALSEVGSSEESDSVSTPGSSWISSLPPSVPSNTLNTVSDNDGDAATAARAASALSLSTSLFEPTDLGMSGGGSFVSDVVSVKGKEREYSEMASSPHMIALPMSRPPSTKAASVFTEPDVGHKGVAADDTMIEVMEVIPHLAALPEKFGAAMGFEADKIMQRFDQLGITLGKDSEDMKGMLVEILELTRKRETTLTKNYVDQSVLGDTTPEVPSVTKVDFAVSPIVVARMECNTSPIPMPLTDRGVSPVELRKFADMQTMYSPVVKPQVQVITLLSPPRKRAVTPESLAGSYLSSHYSDDDLSVDDDFQSPVEDLEVERIWETPQSEASSSVSASSQGTAVYAREMPEIPHETIGSPPAMIAGFNYPLDQHLPPPSEYSAEVADVEYVVRPPSHRGSMLLDEPPRSLGSRMTQVSIQMPVPVKASPTFAGSLAEFMAREATPKTIHREIAISAGDRTPRAAAKMDMGTSPMSEATVLPPSRSVVHSVVESVPAHVEAEMQIDSTLTEKGVSPVLSSVAPPPVHTEAEAQIDYATTEKGVSPVMSTVLPPPSVHDADVQVEFTPTERAASEDGTPEIAHAEAEAQIDCAMTEKGCSPIMERNLPISEEKGCETDALVEDIVATKEVSVVAEPIDVFVASVEVQDKTPSLVLPPSPARSQVSVASEDISIIVERCQRVEDELRSAKDESRRLKEASLHAHEEFLRMKEESYRAQEESRRSQDESRRAHEEFLRLQENSWRNHEEEQKNLHATIEQMKELVFSLAKQITSPQAPVQQFIMSQPAMTPQTPSFPAGFVPQSVQPGFVYQPSYTNATAAAVPLPPSPTERGIPMFDDSTTSSGSSTPSTLRTRSDMPLHPIDMPGVSIVFPQSQVYPLMPPQMHMPSPQFNPVIPQEVAPVPQGFVAERTIPEVIEDVVPPMPEPETPVIPEVPVVEQAAPVEAETVEPEIVVVVTPVLESSEPVTEDPAAAEPAQQEAEPVQAEAEETHPEPIEAVDVAPSSPAATVVAEEEAAPATEDIEREVSDVATPRIGEADAYYNPSSPRARSVFGDSTPRMVPLPASPSGSVIEDVDMVKQAMWDAAHELRYVIENTRAVAQRADLSSRQVEEILATVREQREECARQLVECTKEREAAKADRDEATSLREKTLADAAAEREEVASLREQALAEAAAERERDQAERITRIEELEQELASLKAESEEQKAKLAASEEREAARVEADAEREAKIQALEDELATVRAEQEQEREARAAADAERQAQLDERDKVLSDANAEHETRVAALEAEQQQLKELHEAALSELEVEKARVLEEAIAEKDRALEEAAAEKQQALEEAEAEKQRVLDEAVAEKQRVLDEAVAEREGIVTEHQARITALEEELASLHAQHEEASEQRIAEEAERARLAAEKEQELSDSIAAGETRIQTLEEELAAIRADFEQAKEKHAAEDAERSQAAVEREQELASTITAGEARIQALEEELSSVRAEQERDREDRVAADAEREAVHLEETQAREADLAERDRLMAEREERITALEDELAATRSEYEADKEKRDIELAEREAEWSEQQQAFTEAAAERDARVSALEEELDSVRASTEEAQHTFAETSAELEGRIGTLEEELTIARAEHENAQASLTEYSEKEVTWTERVADLVSVAEERDVRIQALEGELSALREEQEQERQRRIVEEGERSERDRLTAEASLERERGIAESHDARIKELTDELAALRTEREQDRQQDAEQREADRTEAKAVAEAHTTHFTTLHETLEKIQEISAEKWTHHDTQIEDVGVRLTTIEENAAKDRELWEAEKAEAATKPTMESILEGHKAELHTDLQTQLEALENGLRTDSNAKQEEVLSQITAIVQDQAATAIANCIEEFGSMLASLGATQQAEALGALRTAVQEQVTFNISYYMEELSKSFDSHGARLLAEVLDTVRATARDQVEYNTENHLTDFCKNLAPEMLQLFQEIREKEEEKQKLDKQIDVLRRHKRDYESGDLREGETEDLHMKGAWRGRSQGRRRPTEPENSGLPPSEQLFNQVPIPPPSRRSAGYAPDVGQTMSWGSWQQDSINQPSNNSNVQLALISPPDDGGDYMSAHSPFYHE